jgi:PHP family Zn ribbon phosphoesterase
MIMEDAAVNGLEKSCAAEIDPERIARLKERLERSLREAAEIEVELSRADGAIRGVPHYSVIEGRAHELGKQLSRAVQQRQMNELVAAQSTKAKCPTCGEWCEVRVKKRRLQSVDGSAEVADAEGYCPGCRRAFFPSA